MNYNDMSLAELKAVAKEKGLKGISTLKKSELIDLLSANEKNTTKGSEEIEAVKLTAKKVSTVSRKAEEAAKKEETSKAEEVKKVEKKAEEIKKASEEYNVNISKDNAVNLPENNGSTAVENTRKFFSNAGMVKPREAQPRAVRPNINRTSPQTNVPVRDNQQRNAATMRDGQTRPGQAYSTQPREARTYAPRDGQNVLPQTGEATQEFVNLDTGIEREGIFEHIKNENYGFIRSENFLPGEEDVFISPAQIRRFGLKTGDFIKGNLKQRTANEKYQGLVLIKSVNGFNPEDIVNRPKFEDLTPIFPHERIHLETPKCTPAMRLVDLISPVGKGQRGMIVSQPKAGKTTLLKQIANAITINHPEMKIIILLIDERPEEVTDIKESIVSDNVEVIYSTFDELPDNHKRVSEMVIERAKRLVESKQDVCILLDSITRLSRAYNLTVVNSGRTLSGGLDPTALYMPKKFFGAARCMREGGSLTILSTALVDTGSRMDDVVFEEFKGTGNMELVLDRSLSERRVFPAIDLKKSGTRREDLLLTPEEYEAVYLMRTQLNGAKSEDAIETILNNVKRTKNNAELVELIRGVGIFGK